MSVPPPPIGADGLPARLSAPGARRVARRLRRQIRELDAAYAAGASEGPQLEWSLDPEPLFLEPDVWATIEAAVAQRARTINLVLTDLYGPQELLHRRLLPAELVLGDPFYRRPCVGLPGQPGSPATLLRFDLLHTVSGDWVFTDTFANTPIGTAFAVQNRRLLLQERSEYFAALPEFQRIVNFPIHLLDHLRRLSPRPTDNPNIVVLTAGPQDPAYLEHSFLARKMGLPLAQGGDLLVLDERVYYKTVAGLVPIDVVYRRVNDAHIDPLAFSTSQLTGIPGLLSSIRAGHVAVANRIGVGVADNRALEAYMARLARFFLGEKLLLGSVTTYYCGDVDQYAVAADDPDGELALLPAQASRADLPMVLPGAPETLRRRVRAALRRHPAAYVARHLPPPDHARRPATGGRVHRETRLSCFALCHGNSVQVMPGGLVRLLPTRRRVDPPSWQIGETTDIVVLTRGRPTPPPPQTAAPERVRPLLLGSRVAENLFWAGRYAERAEGTARMLSIVEDVGLEEIAQRERRAWFPIWRGLLEATGHGSVHDERHTTWFTPALAWQMTLDAGSASSLLASVRATAANIRQCRDFFSPETWGVLSRLAETLEPLSARGSRKRGGRRDLATRAVGAVLDGLAAFFGTVDRTMLHDTGWHFFHTGMQLERATMTASGLRHALVEAEAAAREERREQADLSALVRMLSSQDAYRRTYQARTEPLFVAELFLVNRHAPKSVSACLLAAQEHIAGISHLTGVGDDAPLDVVRAALASLDRLQLDAFFSQRTDSPRFETEEPHAAHPAPRSKPAGSEPLAHWLDRLLGQIDGLGTALHDFYFSHQARLAPLEPAT